MCKSFRNSINEDYAKMPDSTHAALTGIHKLETRNFENNFAMVYRHSTYRDTASSRSCDVIRKHFSIELSG